MSTPWLPATSFSTEERVDRKDRRLLAALMLGEKFQIPQNPKLHGSKRPCGPFGEWKVHSCSATLGASRTATAQAPGGFMINAPWPETSHLLLPALSQPKTLGGRNGTIFWNHAKTSFTASDLTVMLPSESTSCAPCAANTALTQLTESLHVLNGMPNG